MYQIDISTPIIWYPGQCGLEFKHEMELMFKRAQATQDLMDGTLDSETFLDLLDEQGFDVIDLAEHHWTLPT